MPKWIDLSSSSKSEELRELHHEVAKLIARLSRPLKIDASNYRLNPKVKRTTERRMSNSIDSDSIRKDEGTSVELVS